MVVYRGVGNSNKYAIQADIATDNEIINQGGNNVLYSTLRKAGLVKRKSYFKEKRSSYFDEGILKITLFT